MMNSVMFNCKQWIAFSDCWMCRTQR